MFCRSCSRDVQGNGRDPTTRHPAPRTDAGRFDDNISIIRSGIIDHFDRHISRASMEQVFCRELMRCGSPDIVERNSIVDSGQGKMINSITILIVMATEGLL